jgi:hypothetical protein
MRGGGVCFTTTPPARVPVRCLDRRGPAPKSSQDSTTSTVSPAMRCGGPPVERHRGLRWPLPLAAGVGLALGLGGSGAASAPAPPALAPLVERAPDQPVPAPRAWTLSFLFLDSPDLRLARDTALAELSRGVDAGTGVSVALLGSEGMQLLELSAGRFAVVAELPATDAAGALAAHGSNPPRTTPSSCRATAVATRASAASAGRVSAWVLQTAGSGER